MPNGEFAIMDKIGLMAQNLPSELHNELYPQKLGEKVMMQAPELRVLAKYEGMCTQYYKNWVPTLANLRL